MASKRSHWVSICCYLSICGVLFLHQVGPATAITIDEFDVDQFLFNQNTQEAVASATAVGGTRTLQFRQIIGGFSGVGITGGLLYHTQASSGTAETTVIWDGDLDATTLNPAGLALDLEEDGATAFQLRVESFDFAFQNPITLRFRIYDYSDPSGQTWSEGSYSITARIVSGNPQSVDFPFAQLTTTGPNGGASLKRVGAISFQIDGPTPALDLVLHAIQTNGTCPQIPGPGPIVDACGVCGGNGSSCAGCDGVPNSGKVPDACGVCGGNGASCLGCDGVPNSGKVVDKCGICGGDGSSCATCQDKGLVLDQCGVCGGNGTSCLDCAGTANGTAKVDRCGTCAGDGSSCLVCTNATITQELFALDGNALSQRDLVLNTLKRYDPKQTALRSERTRKIRKEVRALYLKNWNLSWALPQVVSTCANTSFCTSVSLKGTIDPYLENSARFNTITQQVIRKLRKVGQISESEAQRLSKKSTRLVRESLQITKEVPPSYSVCS